MFCSNFQPPPSAPGLQSCSSSHLHGVPQKVPPHHDSHSGAVKISEIKKTSWTRVWCLSLEEWTLECFTGPFFLKKIRGTRQTANYLYIFHSSPKHLPKVRSRGLDHSDKCFFMWFFMWFCKSNVVMVIFEFIGCLYWLPTFVGHTKAFITLKPQKTLV